MNQPPNKPESRLIKLALSYLAIRNRSRTELINYLKLKNRGQDDTLVNLAVASVDQFNLLNDETFAVEFAHYLLNRGKGPFLIKQYLKLKGIDTNLINKTISDLDVNLIFNSAVKQLAKVSRLWHLKDPRLYRPKAFNYLHLRGFSGAIIDRVIDETTPYTVE